MVSSGLNFSLNNSNSNNNRGDDDKQQGKEKMSERSADVDDPLCGFSSLLNVC